MTPRVRFGRVDVDGTHVMLHITVEALGLEYPVVVRFTEEKAHQIVKQFHDAIARLGRTRLPSGG